MRSGMCILLVLLMAGATVAQARPADQHGSLDKFISMQDAESDFVLPSHPGVLGTAVQGTTFYGGTAAGATVSNGRGPWIALKDGTWTFDSGVGSVMAPHLCGNGIVNRYKYGCPENPAAPGTELHTTMEGWTGWDGTYSELTYFRRLGYADFDAAGADTCVGAFVGLGGEFSMWCGLLPSEANALCYAAGQGYGNSWNICLGRQFTYDGGGGNVSWAYGYNVETEGGWDYVYAMVDTTTLNDDVVLASYTGFSAGTANLSLSPGTAMRSDAGDYVLKFCAFADGAYSDEDGLHATTCGMVAVDDVSVTGSGASHSTDFETGTDGWEVLPAAPGQGGEWANIVDISDLPPPVSACGCALVDSVLVFEDKSVGGHGLYQDNLAASPWIDLEADGATGTPGKFVRFDGYFNLPLINYVFVQTNVQWWPSVCPQTGLIYVHPFQSDGFVRYFGGVPTCRRFANNRQVDLDYSDVVDLGAEEIRVALGVVNYCRYYANCTGTTNSTPWFDEVRFGVYGDPNAPFITASTLDIPQDAFPVNGTLRVDAAGRVDCNNVKGSQAPEPDTVLGDTLVVSGATGGAEVWVEFHVRPGDGIDITAFNTWYHSHADGVLRMGPWGPEQWKVARMDTAEVGGVVSTSGKWMTTYHEEDPNFAGTDRDLDPAELYHPGALANDIFPDDLFTAGTRLNLFYRTAFTPSAGQPWFTLPNDTTGGNFLEMEVMPSSMDPDSMFNCVLYVDHFDGRGAQPWIEDALWAVMSAGGYNYEQTAWDRYDVRAPSSGQGSLGRPLGTDYGATVVQMLGYEAVLWNSGNLNATNFSQEDARILIPWLSIVDWCYGFNSFYASGDGLAESIETEAATAPAALRFMNEFCGVAFVCGRVGDAGCEPGSPALADSCLDLNPVGGSYLADYEALRSVQHLAQGNGCPQQRSFDVLQPFIGGVGAPVGDEAYHAPSIPWTTEFASVANLVSGGPNYKTVWDGVSVHYRRDPSVSCVYQTNRRPEPAVEERIREVISWFGYESALPNLCEDRVCWGDVPDDFDRPLPFKTALANFAPNPLVGSTRGTIRFTMAGDGRALVEIFDVGGRMVKTVHDGIALEGVNTAHWNGTDEAGRPVASGVYFYRLTALGQDYAKKLVIVRD